MNAEELRDYYGLLGISPTATVSDIHKAYWQQASRRHPDRGGSHEEMVQLVEAWKILSDPISRARYDQLFINRDSGWRSRKFNDDVREARQRAEGYSTRSWEEFEAIYQKAFYTFNQDFYGEGIDEKAAGPYSPLMGSAGTKRNEGSSKSKAVASVLDTKGGTMFVYIMKTFILFVALMAAFLVYRYTGTIGRYVPLSPQDSASTLMLDTTNGAVYSLEKRDNGLSPSWKQTVAPFIREKKWPPR